MDTTTFQHLTKTRERAACTVNTKDCKDCFVDKNHMLWISNHYYE